LSRSLSHQVGILIAGRMLTYVIMVFVPIVNVRALSVDHYGYYRQFHLLFETLTPKVKLPVVTVVVNAESSVLHPAGW